MKWLHNLLKGMSLTAALFVFQACYGTPPGYPADLVDEEVVEATVEGSDSEALVEEMPETELAHVE